MEERELTHGQSLLDSVDLVLNDPPYTVRSGREDASSHYDVLTLESMADAVALYKRSMRPVAQSHLFYSSFRFGQ